MQWILHASIGKTLNLIFILLKGFLGHKLIFFPLECILFCVRIENIKYILRKGPIYLASTVEVFPHFRVFILFMSTNFSVGFTTTLRLNLWAELSRLSQSSSLTMFVNLRSFLPLQHDHYALCIPLSASAPAVTTVILVRFSWLITEPRTLGTYISQK